VPFILLLPTYAAVPCGRDWRATATLLSLMPRTSAISLCDIPSRRRTITCRCPTARLRVAASKRSRNCPDEGLRLLASDAESALRRPRRRVRHADVFRRPHVSERAILRRCEYERAALNISRETGGAPSKGRGRSLARGRRARGITFVGCRKPHDG